MTRNQREEVKAISRKRYSLAGKQVRRRWMVLHGTLHYTTYVLPLPYWIIIVIKATAISIHSRVERNLLNAATRLLATGRT